MSHPGGEFQVNAPGGGVQRFTPSSPNLLARLGSAEGQAGLGLAGGILGTGAEIAGIVLKAKAAKQRAGMQAAILRNNAKVSRIAAAQTLQQSQKTVQRAQTQTAQFIGRQEAALAANGVLVGEGSAATLVSDTGRVGAEAVADIELAAELAAWQHLVQAMNFETDARMREFEGRQAKFAAKSEIAGALIKGGTSIAAGGIGG